MKPRKQMRRNKRKKNSIWAIKLASIKNFGKNTTDKEWTKKSNEEEMQREPRQQYRAKPDIPESTKNSAAADSGAKKTQHARSTNQPPLGDEQQDQGRKCGGEDSPQSTRGAARNRAESEMERSR
ncbi:Os08g0528050 [Oryza sativa Japonica Group]|uniref:Os08g0528050 protein n=1 Tax=Oryza sativa subsp. japonica TaxID=39947 RepID=A0A0P0XJD4_ORYSJ|nr:Os08g0528050 [Oryza sativa Japonica Group]